MFFVTIVIWRWYGWALYVDNCMHTKVAILFRIILQLISKKLSPSLLLVDEMSKKTLQSLFPLEKQKQWFLNSLKCHLLLVFELLVRHTTGGSLINTITACI